MIEKQRGNTVDYVRSMIFEDIFSQAIVPGQKMTTEALAARYQVTRTPVREALNRLECEHIVESIPNAGFRFKVYTAEEMFDLYEVRESLEGLAVRRLVENGVPDGLVDQLRHDADSAANGATFEERRYSDIEFHQLIITHCGSELLTRMMDNCLLLSKCMVAALRIPDRNHSHTQDVLQEHLAIVEAIAANDATEAEKLLKRHIHRALRAIRAEFRASKPTRKP